MKTKVLAFWLISYNTCKATGIIVRKKKGKKTLRPQIIWVYLLVLTRSKRKKLSERTRACDLIDWGKIGPPRLICNPRGRFKKNKHIVKNQQGIGCIRVDCHETDSALIGSAIIQISKSLCARAGNTRWTTWGDVCEKEKTSWKEQQVRRGKRLVPALLQSSWRITNGFASKVRSHQHQPVC